VHELSVTESILEIALRSAVGSDAIRVTRINITIGDLSSFVDDSIRFYWDLISQGTLCEGASLQLMRIPAQLVCLDCGASYTMAGELIPCPSCLSSRVNIAGGNGFRVDSIDVDVAP